ncbi:MAG: hypothetical protein H0T62_09885 [Parachlamydiaceae bacterium]|nr:hypothetical protein [Parachlamydiaceae bacterium]
MSFNEGLIFLLPCTLIYQKIGEYLKPMCPDSNPYKNWIAQYSSSERRNRTVKFINIIDELANMSENEKESLKTVFLKSVQHEFDFWDAVY